MQAVYIRDNRNMSVQLFGSTQLQNPTHPRPGRKQVLGPSMQATSGGSSSWETIGSASWAGIGSQTGFQEEGDEVEFDYSAIPAATAEEELISMIVELKLKGTLSAKEACTLCFWASRAGAGGEAGKLGLRPDCQSGRYSAHFDSWIGVSTKGGDLYEMKVGLQKKHSCSRTFEPFPVRLAHEGLLEERMEDDSMDLQLEEAISNGEMPPKYFHHPLVRTAPAGVRVRPYVLYLDGIQYARRDSVLGIFCYWLFSKKRHLLAVIRKSELCKCGCHGLCSMRPLFDVIAWSVSAMAAGKHPSARHDGTAWGPKDEGRASYSEQSLGFVGLCLWVKADWSELVHTLGFLSWGHAVSPCPFCWSSLPDLSVARGFSPIAMPRASKTHAHYESACSNCEISIVLSAAQIRTVRSSMIFERRTGTPNGRVLTRDIEELGLAKGDRLEASLEFPDIHDFTPEQAPRRTIFWRSSMQTVCKFRNPLFDNSTGITVATLGVDWLHCLSLGVWQHLVGHLFWALIEANVFEINATSTNLRELSIVSLKSRLFSWYAEESARGRPHTRLENLTLGMVGPNHSPCMATHGAETNGLLRFCHTKLLPLYGARLGAQGVLYVSVIAAAITIHDLILDNPRRFSVADVQKFCDSVAGIHRAVAGLGIDPTPKYHLLMEMGVRLSHLNTLV